MSGGKKGYFKVQGRIDGRWKEVGIYLDKVKAVGKAKAKATELEEGDSGWSHVSVADRGMCLAAINAGIMIDDVHHIAKLKQQTVEVKVGEVVRQYLAVKQQDDLNARYFADMNRVLKKFTDAMGGKVLQRLGHREVVDWLDFLRYEKLELGAKRKGAIRSFLHSLWGWSVVESYAAESIIDKIHKPKVKKRAKLKDILTPAEFRKLLKNVAPDFVAWLAIARLAGLRTSEICAEESRRSDRLRAAQNWLPYEGSVNLKHAVKPTSAKCSILQDLFLNTPA